MPVNVVPAVLAIPGANNLKLWAGLDDKILSAVFKFWAAIQARD